MAEKKNNEPTFESAVERLEQIVEAMEGGELSLEEMLDRYEEGTRLVKLCSEKLAAAEKRIEIVTRNAAGKPQIGEYDSEASQAPAPRSERSASKPASTGDVSLF